MLGRTDSRGRLLLLLVVFVVASTAIVGRLAWWQIIQRPTLAAQAAEQTSVRVEEPARRGTIYDRTGVVALATTIERYRVVVAADKLSPAGRREVAAELSRILGLEEQAAQAVRDRLATGKAYVVAARDLAPAMANEVRVAIKR